MRVLSAMCAVVCNFLTKRKVKILFSRPDPVSRSEHVGEAIQYQALDRILWAKRTKLPASHRGPCQLLKSRRRQTHKGRHVRDSNGVQGIFLTCFALESDLSTRPALGWDSDDFAALSFEREDFERAGSTGSGNLHCMISGRKPPFAACN